MLVRSVAGLTLLELLVTLSILLILQCVAMPSLHHFLMRNRTTVIIDRLKTAIEMARIEAVEQHHLIRFCASDDRKTCGGAWQQGQIIQNLDTNEILKVYPGLPKGYQLIWKSAFQRNRYLDFNTEGFTQGQQGTFYCCVDHNLQYSRGLVVSQSGRVRELDDAEKLGIVCGHDTVS